MSSIQWSQTSLLPNSPTPKRVFPKSLREQGALWHLINERIFNRFDLEEPELSTSIRGLRRDGHFKIATVEMDAFLPAPDKKTQIRSRVRHYLMQREELDIVHAQFPNLLTMFDVKAKPKKLVGRKTSQQMKTGKVFNINPKGATKKHYP